MLLILVCTRIKGFVDGMERKLSGSFSSLTNEGASGPPQRNLCHLTLVLNAGSGITCRPLYCSKAEMIVQVTQNPQGLKDVVEWVVIFLEAWKGLWNPQVTLTVSSAAVLSECATYTDTTVTSHQFFCMHPACPLRKIPSPIPLCKLLPVLIRNQEQLKHTPCAQYHPSATLRCSWPHGSLGHRCELASPGHRKAMES